MLMLNLAGSIIAGIVGQFIVLLNEYMQRNPDLVYEILKEYKSRITYV
jgi:hypothetical protein